jgi:hypothetical protein
MNRLDESVACIYERFLIARTFFTASFEKPHGAPCLLPSHVVYPVMVSPSSHCQTWELHKRYITPLKVINPQVASAKFAKILGIPQYLGPSAKLQGCKVLKVRHCKHVGFEIFTAVTMNNAVFWDVAPCGFIMNRRFGRTCRLRLQDGRNNAS